MADTPDDYWCSVPDFKGSNLTVEEIRMLTIPIEKVKTSDFTVMWSFDMWYNSYNIGLIDNLIKLFIRYKNLQ